MKKQQPFTHVSMGEELLLCRRTNFLRSMNEKKKKGDGEAFSCGQIEMIGQDAVSRSLVELS
jgi:hypothetical protein